MKRSIFAYMSICACASAVLGACVSGAALLLGGSDGAAVKIIVSAAAAAAVTAVGAWYASDRAAKKIAAKINSIDLNNASKSETYEEIGPLLKRIDEENLGKAQTEKMRREFSANVSHELKTPLTSISGYAQMINNGMAKEEDILTFIGRIEKETSRLILLVNDIIKLSNLDEQDEMPESEPIDLAAAAQENIASLESAAKDRGVQLFYSGEKTIINGSRTLIDELMCNIIDNAVKYNRPDGHVTVFVGTGAEGAVFAVKDTGIGIPEADIDRIFERFYRVDKSHSKTVGGTGLGLSIVKHVAMCHNAKIQVKSKVGEGTTISVIFPQRSGNK